MFGVEPWSALGANAQLDCNGMQLSHLNIGTGMDLTIKHLAEMITECIQYKVEIGWDHSRPSGTARKQSNVQKIQ